VANTVSSEREHQETRKKKILNIVSIILLVLATSASGWSAYQATRWNSAQSVSFSESAVLHTEAARRTNIETQLVGIDVGLFVQYATAYNSGNKPFADFLFQRFRPELKAATEAWLKTDPLKNPHAPSSPFAMKEYTYSIKGSEETLALVHKSEELFEKATDAKVIAKDYVFLAMLFELVLFLSSLGAKLGSDIVESIMLSFSAAIYAVGLVLLFSFPLY